MSKMMWDSTYTAEDALCASERHYAPPYPDTLAGAARRFHDEAGGVLLSVAFVLVVFALAVVA